jgi:DNA end-binding protein Ku
MPGRALWSGIITFGLVSIPVKLFTATDGRSISFNQIHDKCGTRIQEKRWCPTCQREVEWQEIGKGFEYARGKYMPISKDDLEAIPLPSKNTIVIQSFAQVGEIDPVYFEKSYYLEPEEKAKRPFFLFIQTLAEKKMVGIGALTLRSKERLCCLRPVGGILIVDTLLYPDEIRVNLSTKMPEANLSAEEKKMAASLMEMMARPFAPEDFKDHYREALERLIEAKLEGLPMREQKAKSVLMTSGVPDLMKSLRESLNVIQGGKSSDKNAGATSSRRKSSAKVEKTGKAPLEILKSAGTGSGSNGRTRASKPKRKPRSVAI